MRKMRTPKLAFTTNRGIGWHVSYRDPVSGMPRKVRFDATTKSDAEVQYHRWLAAHLAGEPTRRPKVKPEAVNATREQPSGRIGVAIVPGSLIQIAGSLLTLEASRIREGQQVRARGTIDPRVYSDRKRHVDDFLTYLNEVHGHGAVGRMKLADLSMADVEGYNRRLVDDEYSESQVSKRMQIVKALIDRAGRPEHGLQRLPWNWDSRDVAHGVPTRPRQLPNVEQLKAVLKACELRERTMIWMAIGLGLGQRDLAVVRIGQIDARSYDLRRGKTGVDRYGETSPLVWAHIRAWTAESERKSGDLLFVTRQGLPLVHAHGDSVQQWWSKLRLELGETIETLEGFYVLRHLGATEYGSRPGCSIGSMKRWLGHSASSSVADVYMRPVSPENRKTIEWVRTRLRSEKLDT